MSWITPDRDPSSIDDSPEALDGLRQATPVYMRPIVWLVAAVASAIIVVAITTATSLVTLNEDGYGAGEASSASAPRTISDRTYWHEGVCVSFGEDSADIVPCSSPERDGQISAVVASRQRCPWGDDYSVRLDDGSFACISTP